MQSPFAARCQQAPADLHDQHPAPPSAVTAEARLLAAEAIAFPLCPHPPPLSATTELPRLKKSSRLHRRSAAKSRKLEPDRRNREGRATRCPLPSASSLPVPAPAASAEPVYLYFRVSF